MPVIGFDTKFPTIQNRNFWTNRNRKHPPPLPPITTITALTSNEQPVEICTSWIDTPGHNSVNMRPFSLLTSNTHWSYKRKQNDKKLTLTIDEKKKHDMIGKNDIKTSTFSVIIMSTQFVPVNGRVHFSRILCLSLYEQKRTQKRT